MSKATFTFTVKEKQELLSASMSRITSRFNKYRSYEEFTDDSDNKELLSAANKLNKAVPEKMGYRKYKNMNEYIKFHYEMFSSRK